MAKAAPAKVSQAEFARMRGVSRKTVTQWKSKGLLVVDGSGQVDVAATAAKLAERPATYRGGNTASVADTPAASKAPSAGNTQEPIDLSPEGLAQATGWSLADATRVKEIFLALRRQREFEVEIGKLVAIEEVGRQVEAEYAIVRERLLTIPGKLAAPLVGLDRAEIESALLAEITEALGDLHAADVVAAVSDRSGSTAEGGPQQSEATAPA